MRRFEPAASRVRRLRSSFTIPTFPGRNARTVSGFNRRPITQRAQPARPSLPRSAGPRLAGGAPRHPPMIECAASSAAYRTIRIRSRAGPSVLQGIIIRHMNDLSKDAVNWLAVGEDGAGPAHRQFPRQDPEGRAQKPHLPDPAQRRGAGEQAPRRARTPASRRATSCACRRSARRRPREQARCRHGRSRRAAADPVRGRRAASRSTSPPGSPSTAAAASRSA